MSIKREMTSEEIKAITTLKRAFTKCKKLGIRFCGMDQDLIFCTKDAFDEAYNNRSDYLNNYNPVAFAMQHGYNNTGHILCGVPYIDSGGW